MSAQPAFEPTFPEPPPAEAVLRAIYINTAGTVIALRKGLIPADQVDACFTGMAEAYMSMLGERFGTGADVAQAIMDSAVSWGKYAHEVSDDDEG